ncbi:MAG: type IV pilus modification PilV family protein [Thermodesulfobacteriota bacterium]
MSTSTSTQKKPSRIISRSQAGFNLIEVMAALGILAFGILAVGSMQNTSLLGTTRAYNLTDGTTVAMDTMESILSLSYSHSDLDLGTRQLEAQGRFTPQVTVTQPADNTKLIAVRVTWVEAGGGEKSTTITSIKNSLPF